MKRKITLICVLFISHLWLACNKEDSENEPTKVFIYSAIASPTSAEKVTIKNNSGTSINLGGWIIGDKNNSTAYQIPNNTIINNGQYKTINASTMGFQINDTNEVIYLWDPNGNLVDSWHN